MEFFWLCVAIHLQELVSVRITAFGYTLGSGFARSDWAADCARCYTGNVVRNCSGACTGNGICKSTVGNCLFASIALCHTPAVVLSVCIAILAVGFVVGSYCQLWIHSQYRPA